MAAATGIDKVIAGTLPAGKAAVVRDLQARGRSVAMVGDGMNATLLRWPPPASGSPSALARTWRSAPPI